MSRPHPLRRASAFALLAAFCCSQATGCWERPAVPTKIYEGGGTAPEVVDQPTKPAGKTSRGPSGR